MINIVNDVLFLGLIAEPRVAELMSFCFECFKLGSAEVVPKSWAEPLKEASSSLASFCCFQHVGCWCSEAHDVMMALQKRPFEF